MEGKQFKEKSKREHRKERMQISNNSKEIRSAKEKKTANNNIRPVKQQHTHLLQNNRKVEKNEWKSFLYCVFTFRLFDLGPSRKVMSKQTKITTKTVREKRSCQPYWKKKKREWYGMSKERFKQQTQNHTNPMKKTTTSQTSNTVLFSETPIKSWKNIISNRITFRKKKTNAFNYGRRKRT